MGKIFNGLTKEIMTAMKSGEKVVIDESTTVTKATALKNLKAKLLEYKTSVEGSKVVNANNGEIPDANEIAVIKKYVKELHGDIELYATTKPSMSKAAQAEAEYLEVYLPKEASASDVDSAIMKYVETNGDFTQKQMGLVVKFVKEQFENVDGGLVAKQIKAYLNHQI